LEPFFFLIKLYINDLDYDVTRKALKFTDDTKVFSLEGLKLMMTDTFTE